MLREERLWIISQQLRKERRVLANQLADDFDLSVATIRNDLAELEKRGHARRVYGGAVLPDVQLGHFAPSLEEISITQRLDVLQAEKEAIGRVAASLIEDGETIMIDSGTTTFQVCRHLGGKKNLTIISCAMNHLWQELATSSDLQIFLTGGFLKPESMSFVGEVAENMLHGFRATKAILGIDGISLEHGLTTLNFMEAGVKKRMVDACQELIIVADHSKFGKVGLIPVAPVDRASKIVTDAGIVPEAAAELADRGVEVILAYPESDAA